MTPKDKFKKTSIYATNDSGFNYEPQQSKKRIQLSLELIFTSLSYLFYLKSAAHGQNSGFTFSTDFFKMTPHKWGDIR